MFSGANRRPPTWHTVGNAEHPTARAATSARCRRTPDWTTRSSWRSTTWTTTTTTRTTTETTRGTSCQSRRARTLCSRNSTGWTTTSPGSRFTTWATPRKPRRSARGCRPRAWRCWTIEIVSSSAREENWWPRPGLSRTSTGIALRPSRWPRKTSRCSTGGTKSNDSLPPSRLEGEEVRENYLCPFPAAAPLSHKVGERVNFCILEMEKHFYFFKFYDCFLFYKIFCLLPFQVCKMKFDEVFRKNFLSNQKYWWFYLIFYSSMNNLGFV